MRRLLGLAFVGILVAGAGLSILTYNKAFDAVTWVTLRTDRVGLQLNQNADVKLRDVVVGHVRSIDTAAGSSPRYSATICRSSRHPVVKRSRSACCR